MQSANLTLHKSLKLPTEESLSKKKRNFQWFLNPGPENLETSLPCLKKWELTLNVTHRESAFKNWQKKRTSVNKLYTSGSGITNKKACMKVGSKSSLSNLISITTRTKRKLKASHTYLASTQNPKLNASFLSILRTIVDRCYVLPIRNFNLK